jgi:hypothetical protein
MNNEKEIKKLLFLKELKTIKPYPIKEVEFFLQGREIPDEILERITKKLCNNPKIFFEVAIGRFDDEIKDLSKFFKEHNFKKEQKIKVISRVIEWVTQFSLEKKEINAIENFFNENEFSEEDKKKVFKKIIEIFGKEGISNEIEKANLSFDPNGNNGEYNLAMYTLSKILHNFLLFRSIPEFKEEFEKTYGDTSEIARIFVKKLAKEWNKLIDNDREVVRDLIVLFNLDEYFLILFS